MENVGKELPQFAARRSPYCSDNNFQRRRQVRSHPFHDRIHAGNVTPLSTTSMPASARTALNKARYLPVAAGDVAATGQAPTRRVVEPETRRGRRRLAVIKDCNDRFEGMKIVTHAVGGRSSVLTHSRP